MAWLLDTNVLVNAKRDHYGFEFCPGFWDWLDRAHAAGVVASVEAVYKELVGYDDELSEWAKTHKSFFRPLGPDELARVAEVNQWANDSNYEDAPKAAFASAADSFLIAQALLDGDAVVTHEVIRNTLKRIPIPNAASALGVACHLPWDMLRVERPVFVLKGAS